MPNVKKKAWVVNRINPNTAEILIYGYISPNDISAVDFVIELSQLAALYNTIRIRINSAGGSVFEGLAMYNAMKMFNRSGKEVETWIDGVAASMASVVALAGKKVKISKYGRMMTHKATGWAEGDADDIKRYAEMVEKAEGDLIKIYAEKTGMTEDEVKEKLVQKGVDKWLTADDCLAMKLVDEIYDADEVPVPDNVTNEKDLVNIFDTCLNKTQIQNSKKYSMKKELLSRLNLPETATDEQIDAAVESALKQKETAESTIANQKKIAITSLLDQAVTDKKIVAAEKDEWAKNFEGNVEGLKMALGKIQSATKPLDYIKKQNAEVPGATDETETPELTDKKGEAWDKLVAKGMTEVEKIRKEQPEVYASLYTDKYGRKPEAMGMHA
jgi:ATP-dependent Clp endopeptidase proteolytic subunit ClpP